MTDVRKFQERPEVRKRRGIQERREAGPGARLVRLFDRLALAVDRRFGWHSLPKPLGLATLLGLRNILRRENLYDTSGGG
jgi:hypothetical protein